MDNSLKMKFCKNKFQMLECSFRILEECINKTRKFLTASMSYPLITDSVTLKSKSLYLTNLRFQLKMMLEIFIEEMPERAWGNPQNNDRQTYEKMYRCFLELEEFICKLVAYEKKKRNITELEVRLKPAVPSLNLKRRIN